MIIATNCPIKPANAALAGPEGAGNAAVITLKSSWMSRMPPLQTKGLVVLSAMD